MLKGKEVLLRPIVRSDLDRLNKWKNDEEVYAYLGGGYQPLSKDQQEKWMDSMIDLTGSDRRFMIENGQGEAIGMAGLYGINWIHRTCEIGIYLGEKDQWGKGYAGEACRLLEEYAREILNLRKIKLKVVSDNKNACAMWEKLGYRQIGEYVQDRYINGKYCNVKLMEKFLSGGYSAVGRCRPCGEAAA